MKKMNCILVILAAIMLLCSCGADQSYNSKKYNEDTFTTWVDWTDEQYLGYLNDTLHTNYKSLEQALNEQVSIYETQSSTDNLCKVCKVCYIMSRTQRYPTHDNIIKYIGKLFDSMAQDKNTYEYVNNNWDNLFEGTPVYLYTERYLLELYESDMKDKFRDVAGNLDLYVSHPEKNIMSIAEFTSKLFNDYYATDKYYPTDDDFRFMLGVLVDFEKKYHSDKKYQDEVQLPYLAILAEHIYECADEVGDTETAETYLDWWDSLEVYFYNLDFLNEKFGTDYDDYPEALTELIRVYNAESSIDNLCNLCLAIHTMPPRRDKMIQYYGELFDKMAQDKQTFEYVTDNCGDLLGTYDVFDYLYDYLKAMYTNGMKDKFRYTAGNLELYISDPHNTVSLAGWVADFLLRDDEAESDDFRSILDELLKLEKKYADIDSTGQKGYLAKQIYKCAFRLGETELALEYKQKYDDLQKEWDESQKDQNGN